MNSFSFEGHVDRTQGKKEPVLRIIPLDGRGGHAQLTGAFFISRAGIIQATPSARYRG